MNISSLMHKPAYELSDGKFNCEYDLSFIYRIIWDNPKLQIKEALRLLLHPENYNQKQVYLNDNEWLLIRKRLAANPETPPIVLHNLMQCNMPVLKELVAANPATLAPTLSQLKHNEDINVLNALAERSDLPDSIVYNLIENDNPDILYTLAENHGISRRALRLLSKHDNPYIATRAQKTLERLRTDISILTFLRRTTDFVAHILKQAV